MTRGGFQHHPDPYLQSTHPVLTGCKPVSTRTRLGGSKHPVGHKGGVEAINRGNTPPSHILSEGGGGGVCRQRKHPLCLTFRVREGGGGVVMVEWETPPPSHISSEGEGRIDVLTEETPPPSHISSEGGGWRGQCHVSKGKQPLCLAIG